MGPILEISGLTIKAGDRPLVSNLDLVIERGERWGVIGESGSGKSLTALASIGLLPSALSAHGKIMLDGQPVLDLPERALTQLRGRAASVVFQEPLTALDPLMRLGRQTAEPVARRLRREGKPADRKAVEAEVLALFERVALPEPARIARAYPFEISGGQRQRVAIAMALACQPQLLIADEPTTALDVTTQAEILALMKDVVADMGMALLFISHDLAVVNSIAEKIVVMRNGEIVETGAAQAVLSRPEHAYTTALLAAATKFEDALEGRP
ncbi:ATP-binding cassette domain-containing protein [Aerobium aerolatum]|uniref:ABC-type dipeptide/oligopeptide/nickel transport system, ATPase component n=1 Tax=Aquamicrobium aerolatum DSM 21857 TaxID=1121003 RepID=A0A1I3I1I2_9HYPH|nr:ABC transporter ATP-binding protein [Aquamicrobium aerolatum]SFI41801.1 ABC-type dipeptide/oligopeptide/nickel transport system, ATPase component [Aquamicrobium aerolatum DSM 21857]